MTNRQLSFFLLILSCCLIGSGLFAQDSSKVYSVKFSGNKIRLSKKAKASLDEVARLLKDRSDYNCVLTGYCITEIVRINENRWDRINKIILYLVENKGVDANRFIFKYESEGDNCDVVDLGFTTEKVDTSPPHPNLRQKN